MMNDAAASHSRLGSSFARILRRYSRGLAAAGLVVALAAAGAWRLDAAARAGRERELLKSPWPDGRSPYDSFVGSASPDFTLYDTRTGEPVTLSDSWGHRPVVLVFGSFSCPRLYQEVGAIRHMHQEYGDRADFRLVYLAEALHENPGLDEFACRHPELGRMEAGLDFYEIDFPCLTSDRPPAWVHAGYPARLMVYDRSGVVVYDARGLSADGLDPAAAEAKLRECLADPAP